MRTLKVDPSKSLPVPKYKLCIKSKVLDSNVHPGTCRHTLNGPGIARYMLWLIAVKGQALLGPKFLKLSCSSDLAPFSARQQSQILVWFWSQFRNEGSLFTLSMPIMPHYFTNTCIRNQLTDLSPKYEWF
jgi:hypothetical protein